MHCLLGLLSSIMFNFCNAFHEFLVLKYASEWCENVTQHDQATFIASLDSLKIGGAKLLIEVDNFGLVPVN